MITIHTAGPEDTMYVSVSLFAEQQYLQQLRVQISPKPALFVYACYNDSIVGCMGLYRADQLERTTVEMYMPGIFGLVAKKCDVPRTSCAEIGTYVRVKVKGVLSRNVSIALTARLLIAAYSCGVRHICFVTSQDARLVMQHLGCIFMNFGAPDISLLDADYKLRWQYFFRQPKLCFGFTITSLNSCYEALHQLRLKEILSDIPTKSGVI